jgi:hypothetical protein
MSDEDKLELEAVTHGQDAWQRLKKDQTFEDWLLVGQALEIGRGWARRRANAPSGRGFNERFSEWLSTNGFADIDKGTRSRLADIMEHRSEIEAWRQKLPLNERLRKNHPKSYWKHAAQFWNRFLKSGPETMTAYATLAAAIAAFLSVVAAFLAVRAAERQEKATFTSALYSKQVDATANIVAQLEGFARAFPSLGPSYTIDSHIHATDADFQKAYADYKETFYAINTINIIYPKNTGPFFQLVKNVSVTSFMRIKEFQNIQNKASPTSSDEDQLTKAANSLTNLYMYLFMVAIKTEECAMEQLRDGRYVNGDEFVECSKSIYKQIDETKLND